MTEKISDIMRRIAFKGTILSAAFTTLHIADLALEHKGSRSANAAEREQGEIGTLLADDAMMLEHGSRAYGVYMGLKATDELISVETDSSVSHIQTRLLDVVDEYNAPISEAAMRRGMDEFLDGAWTEEGLRNYTRSILELDAEITGPAIITALAQLDIPPEVIRDSARVVVTMDANWRHIEQNPVFLSRHEMPFIFEAGSRGELVIERNDRLNAALDAIAEKSVFLATGFHSQGLTMAVTSPPPAPAVGDDSPHL